MQIAEQNEETQGGGRKIYLGVENFHPVAVNPTLAELQAMGIPATEEPTYHGKTTRTYKEGEQDYDYFSVRIFLENKNASESIRTQVQYTVLRDNMYSTTGKYMVINKYGSTTWLEEDYIDTETTPSNMQWYVTEGVKKCYRGEDTLIAFLKALRNLPTINMSTKETDKVKGTATFTDQDLEKLFKGDFTDIRNVIMDSKENKVGFLLGAKTVNDTTRQACFTRLPLKAYIKHTNSTEYLIKQVKDAQDNGSYADTYFDLNDTSLKEYDAEQTITYDDIEEEQIHNDLPFS